MPTSWSALLNTVLCSMTGTCTWIHILLCLHFLPWFLGIGTDLNPSQSLGWALVGSGKQALVCKLLLPFTAPTRTPKLVWFELSFQPLWGDVRHCPNVPTSPRVDMSTSSKYPHHFLVMWLHHEQHPTLPGSCRSVSGGFHACVTPVQCQTWWQQYWCHLKVIWTGSGFSSGLPNSQTDP